MCIGSFLSAFRRGNSRRKAEKGFNWVCADLFLVCADSRLAEPRSVPKGFNWIVRSRYLCALIRGLRNLDASCEGERVYSFCVVQKEPKSMLGRTKSCRWQVFVRRRPPKQGELRTDVSKATMFQGDCEVLRPRFKSPVDTWLLLK